MPTGSYWRVVCAGLGCSLAVWTASSDVCAAARSEPFADGEQTRPVELEYDAAPDCPDRDAFWSRVTARTERRWESAPPRVTVTLRREGERFQGTMRLGAGDAETVRRLYAEDCDEAATAMAVVVALALEALVEPSGPAPPPPEAPPASPPKERSPAPPPDPPEPSSFGIGAAGLIDASLAPQVSWGVVVFTTFRPGASGTEFRLGGTFRRNGTARGAGRGFEVTLIGAVAEACPTRLQLGSTLHLLPCIGLITGQFTARGTRGFSAPRESSLFWNAATLGGTLGLRLGRGWSWELTAHALVPVAQQLSLAADSALDQRRITLFEVSPVSAELSSGVRLEFE